MAQSSRKVGTLIKSTFAIQVAVWSSDNAEKTCIKNNLTFSEMLRPYSLLGNKFQLKDAQGHLYTASNVYVKFSEPQKEPVPDSKLRMTLGEVVGGSTAQPAATVTMGGIKINAATPWFDAYRDTYLDHLKQSDHETIRHYVAAVFVVSSSHIDPLGVFSQLVTKQKQSEQSKHPKWLSPHVYYYYVLLHDVSEGNDQKAKDAFTKVQALYGASNCHLLQLNSQAPGKHAPDLYQPYMRSTVQDTDEVDGGFNLKKRFKSKSKNKSKKDTAKSTPIPNNAHQSGSDSSPEIIKPNVREEAKLIDLDSLNSPTTSEPNQSSMVAPGNDPLSQLASTPADEEKEEEESLSSSSTPPSMRSSSSNLIRQYGQCLSKEDHSNLQVFVQEMVGKKLLTHLNDLLKTLNDTVVKQRSVRRSISYMSKNFLKMFQGPNNVVSDDPNYAHNSIEVLQRQLGDIAFLLQNYELAFHSYHQVKKDFQSSSAWLYYAGAVEMCAMSAYMMSSTRREVVSYLEEAASVYNLSCKAPHYSHRASLLLSEILKERGLYRELTQLYIRMTAEDADLRSAVCVEQAAHAFLRVQPSMTRKYALHLILAGHRYARSAQKVHSTRVYKQALDVYEGKGWTLAEDYIHFSLARHTFSLHRLQDAKSAFENLLSHESSVSVSQQHLNLKDYIYVHRQLLDSSGEAYPEEQVDLSSLTETERLPVLPVPFVQSQLTRVTFATAPSKNNLSQPLYLNKNSPTKQRSTSFNSPTSSSLSVVDSNILAEELSTKGRSVSFNSSTEQQDVQNSTTLSQHLKLFESTDGEVPSNALVIGASDFNPSRGESDNATRWEELEMKASTGVSGVLHENFQASTLVMDHSTDNTKMPFCVVNESVAVGLSLTNPLRIPLVMTKLSLVWKFNPFATKAGSPSPHFADRPPAESEVIGSLVLQPEEERMVTLHVTPFREGELKVVGFVYNLCVDTSQHKSSTSQLVTSTSRSSLLTMSVSSRDSLYQAHLEDGVQTILAEGVRGVVEMDVHGSRLNNTKIEKASIVYGKDYRLQWIVTSPMPKIIASLSDLPSSVIAGEVCRVGLEVYNCGQVALNSLRLTSSFGPLLLLEQEHKSKERPIYPTSLLSPVSLSPPPTLPSLSPPTPSCSFGCIELPLSHGRLDPGEGVKANLILQVSQSSLKEASAELPWDIVFYYEPALITANSRLSHRVIRHTYAMMVKKCPHFKATAVHGQLPGPPSTIGGERFDMNRVVISVESENRCHLSDRSAVELRILQISCASAKWKVSKMDRGQGTLCLLPSESGVVQLKASRLEQPLKKHLCYSDIPLGPTMIPSSGFPTGDLFRGSEAYRALQVEGGSPPPPSLLGSQQTDDEKPPVEEMALIIFWQALIPSGIDTLCSYGHHSLTVPLPQSMSALVESNSSQPSSPYDLVKFYLEHPVSLKFSPDTSTSGGSVMGLCQVAVQVVLQNCSHHKVKAMVELLQPKDGGHNDPKSSRQSHQEPAFYWSGGTCRRHVLLEANSTRTLTVFANFGGPGVYNLNTLRVLVARGESSNYHVQRWQRTSYIIIE